MKILITSLFLAFFSLISASALSQLACTHLVHTKSGASGNFLVKKDGTVIHGDKIYASWGNIRVDDQKIDQSDVKEYHREDFYYIIYKKKILKRVFAAKTFNVYALETTRSSAGAGGRTSYRCEWYVEDIEGGKINQLVYLTDLRKYVASCPAAYALLDMKEPQLRRTILKERRYINDALELHENNCKPTSTNLNTGK